MTHHPDKGGDPEVFTEIAKAYEALTQEEARENWEKYGKPDGPRAASFGIALPSWIVDKNNSFWVLGAYGLVFIVGLLISYH
ncbi:PREDICTED: translocation protein SEC63 homolog [Amphimedon queenslandica]|uniref:J domain-containing protein n=1 Tax=Amphimedon queenslandica TaxID=400682 RepID=A0AAN0JUF4_AMPQE|nr:PREDICTED: translocation protein SEC63 homolog [Amphimedon queenslandica]|eukprot:XP_019860493.1 PREDICTED: translocation protein SEC63 homolog [Amphimedon queenslandica]